MRRRKVPGIGWVYLAVIAAIIHFVFGSWQTDGSMLLVVVFFLIGMITWVLAAPGESIDEMEARALEDSEREERIARYGHDL